MVERSLRISDYTVGWICALPEEALAAMLMLDEEHNVPSPPPDAGVYTYGQIYSHNVVIAQMPSGHSGKVGASWTAVQFSLSFPSIKIYLFVGIGGGVPFYIGSDGKQKPIHLGDVAVGSPISSGIPAIVEYDRGRSTEQGHVPFSNHDQPIQQLVLAVDKVERNRSVGRRDPFHSHLKLLNSDSEFERPNAEFDILFHVDSPHQSGPDSNCSECDRRAIIRHGYKERMPEFHRGTIASGDSVIQNGKLRDELSKQFNNAICFEMEATGVMFETHCLVIRGISDYADSHKNYKWHKYASATAAAFARQLLHSMESKNLQGVPPRRLSTHQSSTRGSSSVTSASFIAEVAGSSAPGSSQRPNLTRTARPHGGNTFMRSDSTAGDAQSTGFAQELARVAELPAVGQPPPTPPNDQQHRALPRMYKRDDDY